MDEITLESKTVFEGKVLSLKVDTVKLPSGKPGVREVVVHPGAVAVVAVTDKDELLLIRQYRYPVGQVIWEIPAGKLEKGEVPLVCAQRELAEETGYGADRWRNKRRQNHRRHPFGREGTKFPEVDGHKKTL